MKEAPEKTLARLQAAEEAARAAAAKNHRMPCVPWRGSDGALGKCIYCGKMPDAITQFYRDRADGVHANRAT